MATIQIPFAEFGGGSVRIEVDLSTANRRVSKWRVVNASDHPLFAAVYEGDVLRFSGSAPAGETTEGNIAGWTLPQQPDYWNEIKQQWEADGIDMGIWRVEARWPS